MNILLKIFWLITFVFTVNGTYSENLDSLINNLASQKADTIHFSQLKRIAIAYSDSNYNKSLDYWQKALQLAEKINKRNLVADSYHQIGYCYQKMGEFALALKNFNNAAEIYSFLDDKKNLGGVLNDIGLIYRNWGKYDKALENYINAQKIFDKILNIEGSAMVSNSIGQIYYYRENYPKAIDYFIRYYNINKKLNNARATAGAANNIASVYLEMRKYDESLQYYLNALKIYDSLNIRIGVAIIRDNIGSLFYQKQQYDDALLYHNSALKIFEELNSPVRICNTLRNIGMVYVKQKRFNSAILVLDKSLALAEKVGQKDAIKDVYQVLAEANQSNGNFEKAYNYLTLYNSIKDSILNAESIEKFENLQAEYEAERRENELASINRQLETQRKVLYTFTALIILLLGLFGLLLRVNHAKKKAIKNIEILKSKILEKLSTTCNNIDIFQHNNPLSTAFSDYWQVSPQNEGYPKSCMLHFKVEETIFAYILVILDPNINPELINITIFNLVSDILRNNPEKGQYLNTIIKQQLLADPLTSSYNSLHYQIIPILFHDNRVLNIADDYIVIKQKEVLLTFNENQWLNIKKDDIVYMYAIINEEEATEEKKTIRKIFKSLMHIEFSNQKEIAENYLKSIEMDSSVIIFALKV
ncbi:MAG: tetratricopeptide repeat protein [Bacteroidales bacterium]